MFREIVSPRNDREGHTWYLNNMAKQDLNNDNIDSHANTEEEILWGPTLGKVL